MNGWRLNPSIRAWHLPGYTHIPMPACATCPYIRTYMRIRVHMSTEQIYNRDTDIAIYRYIDTCSPRHACPHRAIVTRTYIYIYPYAHARGDGLQTNAGGAADVCACAHLRIRTRLDAQASIQTHVVQMGMPPPARTYTRTHAHAPM